MTCFKFVIILLYLVLILFIFCSERLPFEAKISFSCEIGYKSFVEEMSISCLANSSYSGFNNYVLGS